MVHNMYTQIAGRKRFILFPPEAADYLYIFPSIHPSSRQSQINFNSNNSSDLFPGFSSLKAKEVILKPGDVLYIPPFHFHYVAVVGNEVSISISTHTESQVVQLRSTILNWAEILFTKEFEVKQWSLVNRIQALDSFFSGLFLNVEEEREVLYHLLATRWKYLQYDNEVIGLNEQIERATKEFPTLEQLKQGDIQRKTVKRFRGVAIDCRSKIQALKNSAVELILLENYIEVKIYILPIPQTTLFSLF